jgi:hypothetical protein
LINLHGRFLDSHFAVQDVPPKTPIAHQAEKRVLERRGLVVLKKEVTNPGERVPLDESHRNKPPPLRDQSGAEQRDRDARADEMQSAASPVGMLTEIEEIEIAERAKRILVVHRHSPWLSRAFIRVAICHVLPHRSFKGLCAGFDEFDIGNPVPLAPGQTHLFVLLFKRRGGAPKKRRLEVLERIDTDDSIEPIRDSAGDNRHNATPGTDVKFGGLGSEGVPGHE